MCGSGAPRRAAVPSQEGRALAHSVLPNGRRPLKRRSGLGGSGRVSGGSPGILRPVRGVRHAARRSRPGDADAGGDLGGDARTARRKGLPGSGVRGGREEPGDGSTGRGGKEAKDADSWAAARINFRKRVGGRAFAERMGRVRPLSETRRDTLAARRLQSSDLRAWAAVLEPGCGLSPERAEEEPRFRDPSRGAARGAPSPSCRWKPRGRVRSGFPDWSGGTPWASPPAVFCGHVARIEDPVRKSRKARVSETRERARPRLEGILISFDLNSVQFAAKCSCFPKENADPGSRLFLPVSDATHLHNPPGRATSEGTGALYMEATSDEGFTRTHAMCLLKS